MRGPAWVSDVLSGVVVLALTIAPSPGEAFAVPTWTSVASATIAVAALPFRRRWPIAVLSLTVVLFGVTAVLGVLSPGLASAVAIAAHGVAFRVARRTGLLVVFSAVIAVVLLGLLAPWEPMTWPRLAQFGLLILVGGAWGNASRSRRQYIAAMTDRAERAERTREEEARRRVAEERLRIARDLHDTVAHQISVISLNAGVASSAIDQTPDKAKEALASIRVAAREVLSEIGGLLQLLRTEDDEEVSMVPQPRLDRMDELVAQFRATGLDVTVRAEGDLSAAGDAVSTVAYRAVQEALTNALKHGANHRAHVLVSVAGDRLWIVVTNPVAPRQDDSDTIDVAAASGFGLAGLRERVASVRGSVEVGLSPGGWRLALVLPLAGEESR